MSGLAQRRWSAGQATVEHVGLTLVLAVLFGALAMVMARGPWPGAPSVAPEVIAHVAAPLSGAPAGALRQPTQAAPPQAGTARAMERMASMDATGGASGALRQAWDGLLWWGLLNVDGQIEAGRGFLDQVGVRAEDLVKDPVKTIEGAVDRLSRPPVTGTADRVANIVGVLATLGQRPFRDSFLDISRDLGGLGADWLISRFARGAGALLERLLPG